MTSLAILSLILTVFAPIILWHKHRKKKREREFRDKGKFRQVLAAWEPLVLEQEGGMRGVKRFANRVRFLTADDESEDMLFTLAGFIALEEIGCIDPMANEFHIKQCKDTEFRESVKAWFEGKARAVVEEWLDTTTTAHWIRYKAVVTGYRPSDKEQQANF